MKNAPATSCGFKHWAALIPFTLSLFCAPAAHARDHVEIATPYFSVVSVLSEKETRSLIEEMRTFQAVVTLFTSIKDLRPVAPLRIHLVNSSDWRKYLQPSKTVAGFMAPRPLGFDAVMDAYSWSDASIILFHEYMHFVMRNAYTGTYPLWFNEGMAVVFSTVKTEGGRVRVGEPPGPTLMSLRGFPAAPWVPLKELLSAQVSPTRDDDARVHQVNGFYAQCWALVHFSIFVHPNGAKSLRDYLVFRQQGISVENAFKQSFNATVEEIDAKLKRYVQQTKFAIVTMDAKALSLPSIEPVSLRQLEEKDTELNFGRLLVRLGANHERAVEYFDKMLKSDPRNAPALASKANLLEQIKQHDVADAAIKQAIEWAPDDQTVLISAGNIQFVRHPRNRTPEQAKAAFDYYDRAMTLPDTAANTPEIVTRYASLALETRSDLSRVLTRVERTREIYPRSPDLAMTHAYLLMSMNRRVEAREPWKVVAQYGIGQQREIATKALEVAP